MRRILGFLVLLTPFIFAGCPDTIGTVTSTIDHWDFTMGNRGGGTISFIAVQPEGATKRDVCLDAVCRINVEDLTVIQLIPLAKDGSKFKLWEGDPAIGPCEVYEQGDAGLVRVRVSRKGACIAVYEAGTTITPPGIRR
jgi:hypothetical protein